MATKENRAAGLGITLCGGMCWGLSGCFGQYLFQEKGITAEWLVTMRLFCAGLLLILLGLLFNVFGGYSYTLVYLGIACFGLSLVFQLVTLPVEFNASRRAMQAIESANILTDEEQKGARKTLTAAAMTYVAATALALVQLLRLIMLFGGRRKND